MNFTTITAAESAIGVIHKSRIHCPNDIIAGKLFTKETRHALHGRVAGGGGAMTPEKFQRAKIIEGTGTLCYPTNIRINKRTSQMVRIAHPMNNENGFDYTENFDGMQTIDDNTVFVNLKSVVGKGGSQTRTLRDECYPFVEAQLNYLLISNTTNHFFANIFDGDEADARMPMFNYLLNLPEFANVKKYLYVGDLKSYFDWVKSI